ncbi:hypothetical protein ACPV47_09155 [Vibrio jasicida]|uniref:hypothetical protein n=1 Tax=Vibrio harveyi group TaxID=717610 RepID=UPI003AAE0F0A
MNRSELILEYLKVLIWPLVLVVAIVFHGERILKIMETREIDAFGVKLGRTLDSFAQNTHQQISRLKEDAASSSDSIELLENIENFDRNFSKQLFAITRSKVFENASVAESGRLEKVESLERDGFEAILKRDVEAAIKFFSSAERAWPDFHNVSEIKRLLVANKSSLLDTNNDLEWKNTIRTILKSYSWGMPEDIRTLLVDESA